MRLAVLALTLGLSGCCFASTGPVGTSTSMEVRVPASVVAAHASELPMLLFVAETPGTLENRGLALAKICDASSDVIITWTEPLAQEIELTAWIEPTYEGPPIPTCGPTTGAYRDTLIAGPASRFSHASVHVVPGASAHLEVR